MRAREVRLVDPDGEQLGIKLLPIRRSVASWTTGSSSSMRPNGPRNRDAKRSM
ncbi:MAG: hypothetical protein ABSF33_17590 [Acidimicrobiales bacterium]